MDMGCRPILPLLECETVTVPAEMGPTAATVDGVPGNDLPPLFDGSTQGSDARAMGEIVDCEAAFGVRFVDIGHREI